MNVAQLVVACLENEGVRHVFALPGDDNLRRIVRGEDGRGTLIADQDRR